MNKTIIIDAGSSRVRAGFADEATPRAIVSSSVLGASPISLGEVVDVEGWTTLIRHIVTNELKVDPAGCNILLTTPALGNRVIYGQLLAVLFDTFGAAGAYFMDGAVGAMLSQGMTEGVVVEIGHEVMTVASIYGRSVLPGTVNRLWLGGRQVNEYLCTVLAQRGVSVDQQTAQMLKEGLSYVIPDEYEDDTNPYQGDASMSVNGTTYTLGRERFRSAEILLNPAFIGVEAVGVGDMIFNTVMASEMDLRNGLLGNIVLSGGSTLFPGLPERLQTDVARRAPIRAQTRVLAVADRDVISWKGGKVAALHLADEHWISRAEYDSNGPDIWKIKCFDV